ncbi:hypothetical protein JZU51_00470, partial [bacterium]|nr:hypothetical protein [bacterium]
MKITFPKAIQYLLEGSSDQNAASWGVRLLEELQPLLEARHRKLCLAKQHENWHERIGHLEQQLAHLEKALPPISIKALLSTPQKFPVQPYQAIETTVAKICHLLRPGSTNSWLERWLACITIIPSWLQLQRGLPTFPGITVLVKNLPSPSKIMALQGQLTLLRNASNFCVL